MKSFAERIRQSRELARLSQKAMAAQLGVSQGYLNDVEHGRRGPTPKLADAIAAWESARQWPNDRPTWHAVGALGCGWIVADFQQLQFENEELRSRIRELKSANRGMYELLKDQLCDVCDGGPGNSCACTCPN